jgi:hypothetical protein
MPERDQLAADRRGRARKAAVTCAESGSEREGLRIAMNLDELLHGLVTLLNADTRMRARSSQAATPAASRQVAKASARKSR